MVADVRRETLETRRESIMAADGRGKVEFCRQCKKIMVIHIDDEKVVAEEKPIHILIWHSTTVESQRIADDAPDMANSRVTWLDGSFAWTLF